MNKRGQGSLIWGGFLVLLGLLLLADNLKWFGDWDVPIWSLILGAVSLVFLATYVRDRQQWWALIPGLVILGIAVAVFLAELELIEGYVVATIILAGVGVPFLLVFLTDRQHLWALIPGMTMSGIATAVFLEGLGLVSDAAVGGLIVGGIALGFLLIYVVDRRHWWALFPGGIMGVLASFLLVAAAIEYVWPVVLILIGLLMLRGSLGRGRRGPRRPEPAPAPVPPETVKPEHERLPSLEEQIEAAIAEDVEEEPGEAEEAPDESQDDLPPGPEVPEPPQMPEPPEVT